MLPRKTGNLKKSGQVLDSVLPVGITIKRLQTVLHNKLEAGFQREGLTLPQWDVLRTLQAFPGASGARIARECLVTPQTVNSLLPRLTELGLIERRHAAHGRVIETWLTRDGEAALHSCNSHARAVERKLTEHLSPVEARSLLSLLERCTQALMEKPDAEVRFE